MLKQKKNIGILALQGDFFEHQKMLEKLGVDVFLIRDLSDVNNKKLDGVILPGGESTTIGKLLKNTGLDKWLFDQGKNGLPILGTCAGMIILANLGLIDIEVERNAYGNQLDSFEDDIQCKMGDEKWKMRGVFIRAPKVKKVGPKANVLAKHKSIPVLVQQNNILAGSFHPELTNDDRIHKLLLEIK